VRTIAVDPGKTLIGWAVFDGRKLESCGLSRLYEVRDMVCLMRTGHAEMVVEKPQVYPHQRLKGDPNDLIDVALAAGCVAEMGHANGMAVEFVLPRRWKGQRPKDVCNALTLDLMLPHEKGLLKKTGVIKSKRHNVLDAIGIGLWRIGRRP
jgi:hypothetical protein